jgi:hypothetical protein
MFKKLQAAEYSIDLRLSPEQIWAPMMEKERETARQLADAGWRSIARDTAGATRLSESTALRWTRRLAAPLSLLYCCTGGRHLPEMDLWAARIGMKRSHLLVLQCLYELSHLGAPVRSFGCSSGVVELAGGRMLQARSLDWDLPEIGPSTRIIRCKTRRGHEAVLVGLPGQVGALSAMVPGAYSVTINWAPPASWPMFFLGPLFALREVVDTCGQFHEAVNFLKTRKFSSSVFFTVCGTKPGEGCVVECVKKGLFTEQKRRVRVMGDGPLVQTNHYQHQDLATFNPPSPETRSMLEATSRARAERLKANLSALPANATIDDARACLETPPVQNEESCQQMVFSPATGEVGVWIRG